MSILSEQLDLGPSTESRETTLKAGWLQSATFRSRSGGVARHVLGSLAVILGVLTVTFLVTRVFAPNPAVLFLAPAGNGFVSPAAAAEAKEKVEASLGLSKPLAVQYYRFIDDVAHGDLGTSFQTGRPVTRDLLARLPATAELALYALLLGVSLGVAAGVYSAVRLGGVFDHVTRFFTIGGLALPQFWVGLMLLWLFFTVLHLAPGPIGRLP